MIIDNKKAAINFQLRRLLVLFIFSMIILAIYNIRLFRNPVLGIERNTYTIILVVLFACYYFTGIVRNYHYFIYNDMGSKLVFRFYSLRPLTKRQSSIEIDKTVFVDFRINRPLLGFFKHLYLSQHMPNGTIATYPPISISLLKRNQIKALEQSLTAFRKTQ